MGLRLRSLKKEKRKTAESSFPPDLAPWGCQVGRFPLAIRPFLAFRSRCM